MPRAGSCTREMVDRVIRRHWGRGPMLPEHLRISIIFRRAWTLERARTKRLRESIEKLSESLRADAKWCRETGGREYGSGLLEASGLIKDLLDA